MSQLNDKLNGDFLAAYKDKDDFKVSVLRMLKSGIKNAEIAKKSPLTDEEVIAYLKKEVKQRRETADTYKNADKKDMADKEIKEAELIETYLPKQLSEEELRPIVRKVITENGIDKSRTGQAIGLILKDYKSQADGGMVARLVQEELNK